MGIRKLYGNYFVLFHRYFVLCKGSLTDKDFRQDLYDLRDRVRAIDMEELLEKVFEGEPSETRTNLLEYFSNPGASAAFPIMLYYPKLCLQYYKETGNSDVLVNLNERSARYTDTISEEIGEKCDAKAVRKLKFDINYSDLFTGLCNSPKPLEKCIKFINKLIDIIDWDSAKKGQKILRGTDMHDHYIVVINDKY
jgi:hypothetical protein